MNKSTNSKEHALDGDLVVNLVDESRFEAKPAQD